MRPRVLRRRLTLVGLGAILAAPFVGGIARADITDGIGTACESTSHDWAPCPTPTQPDRDPALYGPIGNSAVGGVIR